MSEFAPFIVFFVVFVTLVAWLTARSRAQARVRLQMLKELGFAECEHKMEELEQAVTWLENNSEYRYSIEDLLCVNINGATVYHYTKNRRRQGQIVCEDELLVPLARPSEQGLVLFVKPSDLGHDSITHLIGAMATGAWDSQPDDLTRLRMTPELDRTNIIGALGPAGASVYDLIDTADLSVLQDVGDCGVLIVMCRGNWCSLASPDSHMPIEVDKLWPVLRRLTCAHERLVSVAH